MKKKILITSLIITSAIVIVAVIYGFKQYNMVRDHIDDMHISIDEENNDENDTSVTNPDETSDKDARELNEKAQTFLLLGIGDRPGDPGRSDVIMIVAVNPKKEEILTFNIPRDVKTEIVGKDVVDKINHSYAYGRTQMTKATVEHFLDAEMDNVVQINMQGFRDLVDAVGGIKVDNPFEFSQEDELGRHTHHYDKGEIELDGERALHYSRMRKKDPAGDLGRNERQKQVIQAIMDKAKSPRTLFSLNDTMKALKDNVKTTIYFDEIKAYLKIYVSDWSNYSIKKETMDVEDDWEPGGFYYEVSEEEQERMQDLLADFLENK